MGSQTEIFFQYVDNNYLKLFNQDLVLDVAFWQMKENTPVNYVGAGRADAHTKLGGGGRDWILNNDGTISAKHHPHFVLGLSDSTNISGLSLVTRGSPFQAVFEDMELLWQGKVASA